MKWTSKKETDVERSADAVKGRALALLTQREHSRAELETKLAEFGANPSQIAETVDELVARRLQDDSRFCEAFIRSRRQRGQGPLSISQELRQRGVGTELFAALMDEFDWQAEAVSVRVRRFGAELPVDRKDQARQLRFLQYRGFTSGQAIAAIKATSEDWSLG